MSDPYYQQNNPYQYPSQYDQSPQPSGQYPEQSGAYPPAQQYPQYPQYPPQSGPYAQPSMPLQQGYQQPYPQPVYVQTPVIITQGPSTSGWAIASLVCSLLGVSLLGVIFGHVALSGINKSNGTIGGKGLAIAGLILGYIPLAFEVFFGCLFVLGLLGILGASGGATSGLAPIFH